jgi:hypothetical protein
MSTAVRRRHAAELAANPNSNLTLTLTLTLALTLTLTLLLQARGGVGGEAGDRAAAGRADAGPHARLHRRRATRRRRAGAMLCYGAPSTHPPCRRYSYHYSSYVFSYCDYGYGYESYHNMNHIKTRRRRAGATHITTHNMLCYGYGAPSTRSCGAFGHCLGGVLSVSIIIHRTIHTHNHHHRAGRGGCTGGIMTATTMISININISISSINTNTNTNTNMNTNTN